MPEITENELKKQIERGILDRAYFLFGEEKYVVCRYADRLMERAGGDASFHTFNLQRFDASTVTVEEVANAVSTLPFMAERKCVAVKDFNVEACDAASMAKWKSMLSDLPDSTVLVLYLSSVPVDRKRSSKWKSWLALFAKHGTCVEVSRRSGAELEKLLCAFAAKRGCALSRRDAAFLVSLCGNDLNTLFGEMEKLCAYVEEGDITREAIDRVAIRNAETTVFLLANALVSGDCDKAFGLLELLLRQGEKPVQILAVLSSAYLDLYRVKAALESGDGLRAPAEIFDYRGKEFRLRHAERDVKRLSIQALRESLSVLLETDTALKSAPSDDRTVLETLFTRLVLLRSV